MKAEELKELIKFHQASHDTAMRTESYQAADVFEKTIEALKELESMQLEKKDNV